MTLPELQNVQARELCKRHPVVPRAKMPVQPWLVVSCFSSSTGTPGFLLDMAHV
jgi:hypothetical protein